MQQIISHYPQPLRHGRRHLSLTIGSSCFLPSLLIVLSPTAPGQLLPTHLPAVHLALGLAPVTAADEQLRTPAGRVEAESGTGAVAEHEADVVPAREVRSNRTALRRTTAVSPLTGGVPLENFASGADLRHGHDEEPVPEGRDNSDLKNRKGNGKRRRKIQNTGSPHEQRNFELGKCFRLSWTSIAEG